MDKIEFEKLIQNKGFKLAKNLSKGKINKFVAATRGLVNTEDIYAIYDKSTLFKLNGMIISTDGFYIINKEFFLFQNLIKVFNDENQIVVYVRPKDKKMGKKVQLLFDSKEEKNNIFEVLDSILYLKNEENSIFRKEKINVEETVQKGEAYFKSGEFNVAQSLFRKGALNGDVLSCERLAYINFFKNKYENNNCYKEALKWANLGIERKSEACKTIKGCMYFRGVFGHNLIDEGKKILFERASKNDELAKSYLIEETAYYKKDITINEYKTIINYALENNNYQKHISLLKNKLDALMTGYDYYKKYSVENIRKLRETGNITELKEIIKYSVDMKYYPSKDYYNELSESAKYIHELDNHYKVNYALICDDFTYLDYESSLYDQGCAYYYDGNYDKAKELFIKAADCGYFLAKYKIGHMYLYGKGCEVNYELALEWYNKANLHSTDDRAKLVFANAYLLSGRIKEGKEILFEITRYNHFARLLIIEHLLVHKTISISQDMFDFIYEFEDSIELDETQRNDLKTMIKSYESDGNNKLQFLAYAATKYGERNDMANYLATVYQLLEVTESLQIAEDIGHIYYTIFLDFERSDKLIESYNGVTIKTMRNELENLK